MTDFNFLRKVLVCLSPISAPIYYPYRISPPQAVMPLYPNLLTSGDNMGGFFSDILILFQIHSIENFSCSDLRVTYFRMM